MSSWHLYRCTFDRYHNSFVFRVDLRSCIVALGYSFGLPNWNFMPNYTVGVTKCKWLKNREVITAHKRSLRRLCFHRCLSVHWGGSSVSVPRGSLSGRGALSRGSLSRGSLSRQGVSVWGVSVQRGYLSRGGLCPGGSLSRQGVSVRETPIM